MIKIEGLKKVFDGDVVALDNMNLEIKEKEFVALLGPSGCGKSTTLNCIAGLLDATSGLIEIAGKDVTHAQPKDRNIGMVFQSYALYPHLKVVDNIAFPLKQRGMNKVERHAKAAEMAKTLQIEHLLNRKPDALSGGQQQRVALCRALVKEPKILLMDEPMSNLDARLKIEIRQVIKTIQQQLAVTCILVTHDQEEAMALADRIAILDNGYIQQYDTPEALYAVPKNLFVANFMGNPPMNFMPATIKKEAGCLYFEGQDYKIPVPEKLKNKLTHHLDKEVKIGVRAHQITIFKDYNEETIPMKVQIVENLGKEILIAGLVGTNQTRVLVDSKKELERYRQLGVDPEGYIYLRLKSDINVFDGQTGDNLIL